MSVHLSASGYPGDDGVGTSGALDAIEPESYPELDQDILGEYFAQGDRAALAEAYRRWSPLVYTIAYRTLGDGTEAEDVTQRVFIQSWKSRAGFDPTRRPLPAWLVGITRHVVADRLTERTRERRLQERVEHHDGPDITVDDGIAERVADAVVVADGLSQLDEPRRRVVELSFFDGLTHSQISQRLDLPLGTVKSHIKRGLAQLKPLLEVSDEAS